MDTFSIEAAFRYGWETFKKHPQFFIVMTLIIFAVSGLTALVIHALGLRDSFIGFLINVAATALLDIGVVATLLKIYESPEAVTLSDLWHPKGYLPYLGATLIMVVTIVVGLILFIIPGIIAAALLLFVKFLIVDRNLSPISAIKESVRMTAGHRVTLTLFVLAIAIMNIIAAMLLIVPLLVTIPVSTLAVVYAYRRIGHLAGEVVPV